MQTLSLSQQIISKYVKYTAEKETIRIIINLEFMLISEYVIILFLKLVRKYKKYELIIENVNVDRVYFDDYYCMYDMPKYVSANFINCNISSSSKFIISLRDYTNTHNCNFLL